MKLVGLLVLGSWCGMYGIDDTEKLKKLENVSTTMENQTSNLKTLTKRSYSFEKYQDDTVDGGYTCKQNRADIRRGNEYAYLVTLVKKSSKMKNGSKHVVSIDRTLTNGLVVALASTYDGQETNVTNSKKTPAEIKKEILVMMKAFERKHKYDY